MTVFGRVTRRFRSTFKSLCLAFVITVSTVASASACKINPERNIVDAILNQPFNDSAAIESLIADLDINQAIIPEPDFYLGLAVWYRGYQHNDLSLKKKGIQQLRKVIQVAETKYISDLPVNHLIIGIIKAYTARALFENEQVIKGYYTGIDAVGRLDRFLTTATLETPGYHDARFLLSLYSVYTHDLKTRTHWLIGTIESVGNKAQSIRNIHDAIQSNALFASEAARAFLAEVNWRTPDICNYRNLAKHSSESLPKNLDLALLSQGIFLKCGEATNALQINNRYHTQTDLSASEREKLLKARLRILADLGDIEGIENLTLEKSIESHQTLALANAMDTTDARVTAIQRYNELLSSDAASDEIKRAATVRLTYPYRPPRFVKATDKHSDLRVCKNG